ncbi:MAG TPA: AAA family ATPase [Microvirga sp.]|nr:AAA family ATPase [Microvirga sp.]
MISATFRRARSQHARVAIINQGLAILNRLSLQNVGPAAHLDIFFSPRVNLITGDNGLGKSFLLDIAWWSLTRTWAHYPARPESGGAAKPTISFAFDTERKKEISYASHFEWQNQAWDNKPGRPPSPGMVLYAQVDGGFSVWDPARNYWKRMTAKGVDAPDRPQAYLFSPAEVWDGLARPDPKDASRTEVLCNGLIRDWASWQKEKGSAYKQLCRVLEQLSPSQSELLAPGELTRISLDDVRDMPTLKTGYGKEVAIVHASAAVRRIVALAYLLVWTWQEHARASKLLNQETTRQIIFLIDEVEAHLHPTWQRRILRSLMDVMTALTDMEKVDVQVIAVTHSPMLLASMEPVFDPAKDTLWMFDLAGTGRTREVRLMRDDWHRRGDASAWLQSEVFDLKEARSEEAEKAIAEARDLMLRDVPDRDAFLRIYDSLRRSMPGVDPFWVDWRAWGWRHGLLDEKKP